MGTEVEVELKNCRTHIYSVEELAMLSLPMYDMNVFMYSVDGVFASIFHIEVMNSVMVLGLVGWFTGRVYMKSK